uniref:Haloacid dehalogenase-like hydrolase domain-containing protein 2 n=1 Tax=Capra hircus TaxID=9925 RepID=A0A8C2R9A6_CAPHI
MAARRALKAVLVDLSGTLHIEDAAVPGAQEALKRQAILHVQLTNMFVSASLPRQIITHKASLSLSNSRSLLKRMSIDNFFFTFSGIQTSDPNAVVIGLAPEHFNYQILNQAFRLLLDGAPLIAIHKARYYKRKDGLALGPGPFVTALEYYATDTKATVVGKPEKTFFLEALRGTGCEPEETVMIGDDCRDDVGGAQNAGMRGILVKTGKYRAADEDKINPAPYLTCESFPHAVDHILQHLL